MLVVLIFGVKYDGAINGPFDNYHLLFLKDYIVNQSDYNKYVHSLYSFKYRSQCNIVLAPTETAARD